MAVSQTGKQGAEDREPYEYSPLHQVKRVILYCMAPYFCPGIISGHEENALQTGLFRYCFNCRNWLGIHKKKPRLGVGAAMKRMEKLLLDSKKHF
jgi:Zn-finger protein